MIVFLLKAPARVKTQLRPARSGKTRWQAEFTNSASQSGDQLDTLIDFAVFAAQMGMIWIALGDPTGNKTGRAAREELNHLDTCRNQTAIDPAVVGDDWSATRSTRGVDHAPVDRRHAIQDRARARALGASARCLQLAQYMRGGRQRRAARQLIPKTSATVHASFSVARGCGIPSSPDKIPGSLRAAAAAATASV